MRRDVMIRILAEMAVKGGTPKAKPQDEAVKLFLEGICLGSDAEYLDISVEDMEKHIINFLRALHYLIGNFQEANTKNIMAPVEHKIIK